VTAFCDYKGSALCRFSAMLSWDVLCGHTKLETVSKNLFPCVFKGETHPLTLELVYPLPMIRKFLLTHYTKRNLKHTYIYKWPSLGDLLTSTILMVTLHSKSMVHFNMLQIKIFLLLFGLYCHYYYCGVEGIKELLW